MQGGESHGGVGMLIARYSTAEYLARTVTRYVLSQLPIFLSISFVVSSVCLCLCLSYFIKKEMPGVASFLQIAEEVGDYVSP